MFSFIFYLLLHFVQQKKTTTYTAVLYTMYTLIQLCEEYCKYFCKLFFFFTQTFVTVFASSIFIPQIKSLRTKQKLCFLFLVSDPSSLGIGTLIVCDPNDLCILSYYSSNIFLVILDHSK